MKKKLIITSVMTIAVCLSLIAGSTFAYFTSTSKANIAATAAKVNVAASIDESTLELYSLDVKQTHIYNGKKAFENMGTAEFDADGNLVLDRIAPGDKVKFNIAVDNESNITVKYNVKMVIKHETGDNHKALADNLVVKATIANTTYTVTTTESELNQYVTVKPGADITAIPVSVELPKEVGNDAQEGVVSISFILEAVQGNGEFGAATSTETETATETETETETN
jgi:predicted ribosomally synthesized peptide with SipW-like signal peptide